MAALNARIDELEAALTSAGQASTHHGLHAMLIAASNPGMPACVSQSACFVLLT